MPGFCIKGT